MELIYKYYGFEAGLAALRSKTLGFSKPNEFNDPMDGRLWFHQNGLTPSLFDGFLDMMGILCMTKDPLNPLMWAHYGQHHTGFVIGYDLRDPIFGDQIDSVFDASSGQIFFTPEYEISDAKNASLRALQLAVESTSEPFTEEIKQVLRHIFLMKQECWRYEKETRIVKVVTNPFEITSEWRNTTGNNFKPISTLIAPKVGLVKNNILLLQIPPKSIKRVILGMENPLLQARRNIQPYPEIHDLITASKMQIEQAKWDDHGGMQAVAVENDICWGDLKKTVTQLLSPNQLRVISSKLYQGHYLDQNMRITQDIDDSVLAFWEGEFK